MRPDPHNPDPEIRVASADHSLLAQFNYLSTVSGGGYVGSWLSAWLKRAHDAGPDGWPKVWASLAGPRPDPDEEPAQITWLRTYSNYLTPQLGLTSADTWAAIAIFLRNLILNWFVLVPVLAAVLLALKVVAIALVWISVLDPQRDLQRTIFCKLVILGVLGLLVALYFSNWQRPTHGPSRAVESTFLKWDLLPGCLAALLLTCALAAPQAEIFAKKYLIAGSRPSLLALAVLGAAGSAVCALSWIGAWLQQPKKLLADFVSWVIGGFIFGTLVGLGIYLYFSSPPAGFWPFTTKEILLLTVGVPWGIVSGLVVEMIFIGLTRDMPGSDTDREWLGRAAGWYLTIAIAWPVAMTLVFVGSILANHFYGELSTWITAGGAGTITALLGKSSVTPAKNGTATWTILSFNVILAIAAIVFAVALIVGLSALLDHILFGKPLVEALPHTVVIGKLPGWPGGIWVPIALGLVLFLGFVASWRVNINRFSLHALYRNRLIRGFLGASNLNRERTRNPFTNFDESDNLRVHELWPRGAKVGPNNWRPFHVVNMALNLAATKNLAWQERKAESFTASPLHSGSSELGYRDSMTYGDGQGISLGTAMAISGAAASPNMGYHSSPPLALLLTLFNVRLGWWLGNPGKAGERTYSRSGPWFAIKPLLFELFGQTTETSKYVYLSDGGHFENLALYEMVRRRCRYIVVIDAGCDKEFAFEDLGNAVRKISIDLGVTITFKNLKVLRFREEKGVTITFDEPKALKFREEDDVTYAEKQPPFYALGVIHYPADETHASPPTARHDAAEIDPDTHGLILYLKPSFLGGRITNAGVRNYATANPDFPHQSTGNQWFTESQLESYRALGFEMMDSVLTEIAADKNCRPNPSLPDIFTALAAMSAASAAAGAPGGGSPPR